MSTQQSNIEQLRKSLVAAGSSASQVVDAIKSAVEPEKAAIKAEVKQVLTQLKSELDTDFSNLA